MCFDPDRSDVLVVVSISIDLATSDPKNPRISLFFSWVCCYMAQMNPLIGPKLHQNTILIMAREWGNPLPDANSYVPPVHAAH